MLIDCPACARSYHLSRAEIGEEGRTVMCPRCDARWFVDSDGTGTLIPPPEDLRTTAVSSRPRASGRESSHVARMPFGRRVRPAAAAAMCLASAMGLIGARTHVVRLAPRTAGLYAAIGLPVNVRGLEIATLAPERPAESPSDMTVSGEIRNIAQKRVAVPRLTYEIRDAAGTPLVTWTERAGAKTIGTGKTLPFVSSPHRLPADAKSILVRFEDDDTPTPIRLARHVAN